MTAYRFVLLLVITTWASTALAYQTVKVAGNGGTVFQSPKSDSPTTGTLKPGSVINIGDAPTNGFYRCSAAGGIAGWISADEVIGARKVTSAARPRTNVRASSQSSSSSSGEPNIYVGALGGLGIVSAGSGLSFGVDGGYKFNPEMGIGVFFAYQTITQSIAATSGNTTVTATASAAMMAFAGEFNYFFQNSLKGFHAGGKAGGALFSISSTATTSTGTTFALPASVVGSTFGFIFGGGVGYDYAISRAFSIGTDANFFVTTASGNGTLINILASAKYGF